MRKSSKLKPDISHDELVFIANDSDTSPEILREIYTDYYDSGEDVIYALAANPSTPPDILEDLSNYEDGYEVREAVALNPNTSLDTLRKMVANEQDYDVLRELAGNKNLTLDLIETLYDEFSKEDSSGASEIIAAIAKRSDITAELIKEMAASDYIRVRAAIAGNEKTPPDILYALYKEASHYRVDVSSIYHSLAKNKNLPSKLALWLVNSGSYGILSTLATNISLGPEVLDSIADKRDSHSLKYIVQHPNTSRETLVKILNSSYGNNLRRFILKHPNSTDEMKAEYIGIHKEDSIEMLEGEDSIPKLNYRDTFSQPIKYKVNNDLELLKRLKGHINAHP